MAKRNAVRIDDCQRTMALTSGSTSVGTMTIHVPDMLMRANRRQYTQCRAYDIQLGFCGTGGTASREFHIYTLSNAWWVKRSIELAKGTWLAATKKERSVLDQTGRSAKWGDFIISCATGAAGNFSNLVQFLPATSGDDIDGTEVASDESIYELPRSGTDLTDVAGDEMGFSVLAEDVTGDGVFNIFDQYLLTRQHVSPQDTRAGPYADLHEMDSDAMLSLKGDGDQAPYDLDSFPSPFVLADAVTVDAEGSGDNIFSRMLTAPLGLVLVKKLGNDGSTEVNYVATDTVLLRARKGSYKGVHAPAYNAFTLG